jgi:hypothetical protein
MARLRSRSSHINSTSDPGTVPFTPWTVVIHLAVASTTREPSPSSGPDRYLHLRNPHLPLSTFPPECPPRLSGGVPHRSRGRGTHTTAPRYSKKAGRPLGAEPQPPTINPDTRSVPRCRVTPTPCRADIPALSSSSSSHYIGYHTSHRSPPPPSSRNPPISFLACSGEEGRRGTIDELRRGRETEKKKKRKLRTRKGKGRETDHSPPVFAGGDCDGAFFYVSCQ